METNWVELSEKTCTETEEAISAVCHGNWPENVRDAERQLEALVTLTKHMAALLEAAVDETEATPARQYADFAKERAEQAYREEKAGLGGCYAHPKYNAACEKCREFQSKYEQPANDPINPSHYKSHPSGVECIEITRHMTFNSGNVFKYLWRAGLKDATPLIQDFKKAQWYLNDEIARIENGEKAGKSGEETHQGSS